MPKLDPAVALLSVATRLGQEFIAGPMNRWEMRRVRWVRLQLLCAVMTPKEAFPKAKAIRRHTTAFRTFYTDLVLHDLTAGQ